MPNAPLCALVHDDSHLDPRRLAASARACLEDVRKVVARHGFIRTANGLSLAALALQDDLAALAEIERASFVAAE